jgi:hypothetical protein
MHERAFSLTRTVCVLLYVLTATATAATNCLQLVLQSLMKQ